jgi:plasmid stability protein
MPNLSIKDVPAHIAQKLRERAARNHRSLQGELMALITRAALDDAPGGTAESPRTAVRSAAPGPAAVPGAPEPPVKTIEQIAAEHRARWPQPFACGPFAVDILRADRDAR